LNSWVSLSEIGLSGSSIDSIVTVVAPIFCAGTGTVGSASASQLESAASTAARIGPRSACAFTYSSREILPPIFKRSHMPLENASGVFASASA